MTDLENRTDFEVAKRWCLHRGNGWSVEGPAGKGGTATVFLIVSPNGPLALKLFSEKFSHGSNGEESERRLEPQIALGLHDCPTLVRTHDAGRFEDRIYILLDRAEGKELEKELKNIPREYIRSIIDQVARAVIFLRSRGFCHRDIKSANIFISEDFQRSTLLDLSVLRDVNDPIGIGTDHGDQLPVVATSRYSPPEYLFRLIEPGIDLWHALDVYQLGGLLHDLIMREPMFEQEYVKNRDTNRYRFAWVVATQEPFVEATDVDPDLVSLARRALDKNWKNRGDLRIEDFLNDKPSVRSRALQAIGANIRGSRLGPSLSEINTQMEEIAKALSEEVAAHLRASGITSIHERLGSGSVRCVCFEWTNQNSPGVEFEYLKFYININRKSGPLGDFLECSCKLEAKNGDNYKEALINLPDINDLTDCASLTSLSMDALPELADRLMRV